MEKFWLINRYIYIIVFVLFCIECVRMFGDYNFGFYTSFSMLVFLCAPFLELFQLPICSIVKLVTWKKQNSVWRDFLMMTLFFSIKICLYAYIFMDMGVRNN